MSDLSDLEKCRCVLGMIYRDEVVGADQAKSMLYDIWDQSRLKSIAGEAPTVSRDEPRSLGVLTRTAMEFPNKSGYVTAVHFLGAIVEACPELLIQLFDANQDDLGVLRARVLRQVKVWSEKPFPSPE